MTKLAAAFIFGGFLLAFGAVGGMENPDQADYFVQQVAAALAGVFFMFVGTALLPQEQV